MDILGDLLARDRRSDRPACRVGQARGYDYRQLCTTAWKTANFFSYRGVHAGATVAVVDDPAVPAVLSLFGAAQQGATTRFVPDPGPDGGGDLDAGVLVGPGETVLAYELPPGATRVAYTDGPDVDDPGVVPFGRSVWSENPVEPPETVAPDATALATTEAAYSHRDLLAAAEPIADAMDAGTGVVVRAPFSDPRTVVAGVLAPLWAGATVVFPAEGRSPADSASETIGPAGEVAVAAGSAAEPRTIALSSVSLDNCR